MDAIDLSFGGAPWSGWHFGKWGRSKDFYLFDAHGQRYSALEIIELEPLRRDVSYQRQRIAELERLALPDALHFGPRDAFKLVEAMEVLQRAAKEISLPRLERLLRQV